MLNLALIVERSPGYGEAPKLNAEAILDAIKRRAIAKWGEDKWQANLTREYVKLVQSQGDTEATYNGRKRNIYRIFEAQNCNLDTAVILVAAVGGKFQLKFETVQVEVEEF